MKENATKHGIGMYLRVLLVCTPLAKLEIQQGQVKNLIECYYWIGDMEYW